MAHTASLKDRVVFGRTGLSVSRLAIGSSYGVGGADLERAYDRGHNFMFWGLRRTPQFAEGVRAIARRDREGLVVAIQSYSRSALLLRLSVDRALKKLGLDRIDLLGLGWWNDPPPPRILDAAKALQDRGKIGHLMISSHIRTSFEPMIADPSFGAIMVRYNAAHPGAEREVFPLLGDEPPGVLGFTATRWGTLISRDIVPQGEQVPTAGDCYRFVLSHPDVHVSLCGPRGGADLDHAMDAIDRGPMSEDELAWMRRVGKVVHAVSRKGAPVAVLDRIAGVFRKRRPAPSP